MEGGTDTPITYHANFGPQIEEIGVKMVRRPNPVFMIRKSTEFYVETDRGIMAGKPGDYIAFDPISGQVWPVSPEYVEQHYDEVTEEASDR